MAKSKDVDFRKPGGTVSIRRQLFSNGKEKNSGGKVPESVRTRRPHGAPKGRGTKGEAVYGILYEAVRGLGLPTSDRTFQIDSPR